MKYGYTRKNVPPKSNPMVVIIMVEQQDHEMVDVETSAIMSRNLFAMIQNQRF